MRILLSALVLLASFQAPTPPKAKAQPPKDSKAISGIFEPCGCWSKEFSPLTFHQAKYLVSDDSGFQDFACNVGTCERVSETVNRLSYWRHASGDERTLIAPVIRCQPVKNALELWKEHEARTYFSVLRSDAPEVHERLSMGSFAERLKSALERGDKAEYEKLAAEVQVVDDAMIERIKAEIARTKADTEKTRDGRETPTDPSPK